MYKKWKKVKTPSSFYKNKWNIKKSLSNENFPDGTKIFFFEFLILIKFFRLFQIILNMYKKLFIWW